MLGCLERGSTNREIARACGTSPHAVRNQANRTRVGRDTAAISFIEIAPAAHARSAHAARLCRFLRGSGITSPEKLAVMEGPLYRRGPRVTEGVASRSTRGVSLQAEGDGRDGRE